MGRRENGEGRNGKWDRRKEGKHDHAVSRKGGMAGKGSRKRKK